MTQDRFTRFKDIVLFAASKLGNRSAALVRITTFAAALGTVYSNAATAQELAALPPVTQQLGWVGNARPVAAWVRFCDRFPGECVVDTGEPEKVTMTPEVWRTLVQVNRKVNSEIKPMTDKDQWGVIDSWDFPSTGYGDCEDYQLLKRKLLVEAGLPRRALRMTVVIDELGEGHAVLTVRTDRGDYILDNKTSVVLPWDRTGYVFVKREGQKSLAWVSLGGVSSPSVVATARR